MVKTKKSSSSDNVLHKLNTRLNKLEKGMQQQRMVTVAEFAKVHQRLDDVSVEIKLLPTKQEFFTKMDEVITEVKNERDEHTVMRGQVGNHEVRIRKVEKHAGISY